MDKRPAKLPNFLKAIIIIASLVVVLFAAGVVILQSSPSVGAYGAEYLRKILGNDIVVAMETALFNVQDIFRHAEYNLGIHRADSPWSLTPEAAPPVEGITVSQQATKTPQNDPVPVAKVLLATPVTPPVDNNPLVDVPPATPAWMPPPVTPIGNMPGVGVWEPYIFDNNGQIVAYRSFVQPDPGRPYALTAIVAFDLRAVRLHYIIGFTEPYVPNPPGRSKGEIPVTDKVQGVLLAAFNGGFKFEHGQFGSMSNGLTSVPPRAGFAAVAMYQDGSVRIGEWGKDITPSADLVAFRENGPLVIDEGQITPQVDNPAYWGYTLTGATVTWRSGIAVNKENTILYYFAGSYNSIDTLSQAMQTVHPWYAMQLDINNFWVAFETFKAEKDGVLVSEPLFPAEMKENKDRFLFPYTRDFFYITAANKP
jgi:hypothetical protein